MNVQTIIEAARRDHFSHNNAIIGFETMVAEGFHKPFVRDLDPELGCDGIGVVGTGSPGREGLVGSSNDNHADSEECLEEVWGDNAVNNLAGFLRALSAWYSLRDVERLVRESCDRIDLGVSVEVAAKEADFALEDVKTALQGTRATPKPHAWMTGHAVVLQQRLRKGAEKEDKATLKSVFDDAQGMRDAIATTTQEGPRTPACQ